jgi:ribonuclease HI
MLKNNIKSNYKITINMTNIYYDKFIVYTDGACRNNGKSNALSSIGIYFSNRNLKKIDSVSEVLKMNNHTNNIAELTAINKSLRIIKENDIKLPIQLYTDSQYSIKTLTKWYPNWSEKDKKTKKNVPLITDTYNLICDIKPELNYVKAHTGNGDEHSLGNAIADQLANDALDKFEKNNKGILKYFQ